MVGVDRDGLLGMNDIDSVPLKRTTDTDSATGSTAESFLVIRDGPMAVSGENEVWGGWTRAGQARQAQQEVLNGESHFGWHIR